VAVAKWGVGLEGWSLLPVALAPILGHAFSPLLSFRGGKAVAVTMGVWTALTLWEVPTVGGILLGVWFAVVSVSGWAVVLMGISVFAYLLLTNPDPVLLTILVGNALVVSWKYRDDLRLFPALRPWIQKRLVRS
jgi:glycerol-3-phosphate acyltransferase PlsY